jgi:hypothetical protein
MTGSGSSTLGASEILDVFEEVGAELERPALALRIRVAVRRRVLDKDLARGDGPLRSDVYALRARQLVERRSRERLARALERLVEGAERTPSPSEIVSLPKREILDAHGTSQPGAPVTRHATGIRVRGGDGLATCLDGTGPAFTPRAGLALRRAIAEATVALEGMFPDEPVSQR